MSESRRGWIAVALLIGLYAVANAAWLYENGLRCMGSAYHARHFLFAARFHALMERRAPMMDFYDFLHVNNHAAPPLHPITTAAAMAFLGKDDVPIITGVLNFFYFAIALVFIVLLARELKLPGSVGIWAAVLYALYPAVYGLSRLYGAFDFQVASLMPLSVFCLLRTQDFDSRRDCLLMAAVMSVGLLLKDTYAAYFGPVLLAVVWRSFSGERRKARIVNFSLMLALAAAGSAVYYAHPVIIDKEIHELWRAPKDWSFLNNDWGAYTIGVPRELMSPPFFLLFSASLIWAWLRRFSRDQNGLLIVWSVAPWVIIMLMKHYKQPSYFVPILPAAALLSAMGLNELSGRVRAAAQGIVLAFGLLQFSSWSFALGPMPSPAYFQMEQTILFNKNIPVEIDSFLEGARKIAQSSRGKILVLQGVGQQRSLTFYQIFNQLYDLKFQPVGRKLAPRWPFFFVEAMFEASYFEEEYEMVLLPLPLGWSLERYVEALHREMYSLALRHELSDARAVLEQNPPEEFSRRLEKFLSAYPVKEKIAAGEGAVLWLYSRPKEDSR